MKINQHELILTHSPRKNILSQIEFFLIFFFKSVLSEQFIDILICNMHLNDADSFKE